MRKKLRRKRVARLSVQEGKDWVCVRGLEESERGWGAKQGLRAWRGVHNGEGGGAR